MANFTVLSTTGGSATYENTSSRSEELYPGSSWHSVNYYKTYTLTATPDSGYEFVGWRRGGSSSTYSTANPLVFEHLDYYVARPGTQYEATYQGTDETFTAVFRSVAQHTVTTAASPVAGGTTTGDGQYAYGSTCILSATPANGYEFVRWVLSTGVTSTSRDYSFTVTQDTTATAYFRQYTNMLLHGSSNTLLHGSSGTLLHDA